MNSWDGMITFLGTEDLEKTHRFYTEALGLTLYKDQGLCRIYNISSGGKIGFCSHVGVVRGEKSPIITLLTEDVDGMYNNLKERGYSLEEAPKVNPKFNIYHFFMKDSNGYTIEIQRFLD